MTVEKVLSRNALNVPNLLTCVRIALLPVIFWRFRLGDHTGALSVYLCAMLTDVADGFIARQFGQITTLGKLLDPIADKLSLLTILSLFASDGQIPLWMIHMIAAKEILFILGSAAALHFGIVVSALPIGKVTTLAFVLSTVVRFLGMRVPADILLVISLMLSGIALLWYGAVLLHKLQSDQAIA